MKVVVFKGVSQVGKSQVVRGLVNGANRDHENLREIEFSDAMVRMANRALAFDPVSGGQLERMLLLSMQWTLDLELPNQLPSHNFDEGRKVQRDIMRRDFLDWSRTIPPGFQLTPENKDANRIILTWLAMFGRYVARDNAIFTRPILQRLEADELAGNTFACVGGMRFPEELAAMQEVHDVLVVEVKSARRPEDHDLANIRRDEIVADAIYYSNFRTPEDSYRFARDRLWSDFRAGSLAATYGTPA